MPPNERRLRRTKGTEGTTALARYTPPNLSSTSSDPVWWVYARPLDACHDQTEYAIRCPRGCGRERPGWRLRQGEKCGGWICAECGRGSLWQLDLIVLPHELLPAKRVRRGEHLRSQHYARLPRLAYLARAKKAAA